MFFFLNALLITLHNDCYEDILYCRIEQDHKNDEVQLAREPFRPCLQKRVVNDISIEE